MIGAEDELPYDRPNLSKDYLAGTCGDEWLPIKPREFYEENEIELMLGHRVSAIDTEARELRTLKGRSPAYDRLLIATGSEAVRLPIPTHGLRHVHTLRTVADSRAIIAASATARRAVVVGGSFIGLEVAASLRARGVDVDLVAPSGLAFERIFGPTLSAFIQRLHEAHGVSFHLGASVKAIDATHVTLTSGKRLPADLVVVGIGVRPSVAVAQWARLEISQGIVVDDFLETSKPGIFAAGDVARWRDPHSGESMRVEHWNVALRQGQTAARNMLGERVPFDAVPFFWSQHYDVTIKYVGRQTGWDELAVDGDPEARDCTVEFRRGGAVVAVATIGRDVESLRAELAFERGEVPAGAAAR
jgi:NADPH-dependent 2,4-dienoyl-CoA reductase/sulfur reductase-like enzyme